MCDREKWRLALDMIDELGAWGLVAPLIAADAGYGEITAFRQGLDDREIPYVVQVKSTTSAYPSGPVASGPPTRAWAARRPRATARSARR